MKNDLDKTDMKIDQKNSIYVNCMHWNMPLDALLPGYVMFILFGLLADYGCTKSLPRELSIFCHNSLTTS